MSNLLLSMKQNTLENYKQDLLIQIHMINTRLDHLHKLSNNVNPLALFNSMSISENNREFTSLVVQICECKKQITQLNEKIKIIDNCLKMDEIDEALNKLLL